MSETAAELLERLYRVVLERKDGDPDASYIARLFTKGSGKIAQKVGEEAVETALAAASRDKHAIVNESADLLFHLLILWADTGVQPAEVLAEIQRREGTSGLVEKAGRKP